MTGQRGFTLLEMALVLAVLGLLVGGGLMALGPLVERARMNQTKTNMDQIESALVLFAIRNNRLPCPADGSLASGSASYGLEQPLASGASTNAAACSGTLANSVIPWRTLGLDEQYSMDGWNNRISYFPANHAIAGIQSLVDSTPGSNCLMRNTASVQNRGTSTTCDVADVYTTDKNTYPFGNYIAVYSISSSTCSTELTQPNTAVSGAPYSGTDTCTSVSAPVAVTTLNATTTVQYDGGRAAYVLISHGKSGWDGWNKAGNQITPPGGIAAAAIKAFNNNGSAGTASNLGFVQGPPQGSTGTPATYFDDIVRWRSPSMIIQLCGSGACGNP